MVFRAEERETSVQVVVRIGLSIRYYFNGSAGNFGKRPRVSKGAHSCIIARHKRTSMRTGRTLHPEDVISRYRVVGPLGAGGAPEPLTHFTDGKCTAFRWSADGSRLAVARKIGDVSGVFVTTADGGKPIQAARFQGNGVFGMDWSKDGKSIVVDAGKRSSDALLVRNFR